jgi:hypothetical protein
LLAAAPLARATNCTWNTTTGNWTTTSDWSCGAVPDTNDFATIGSPGIVTVNSNQAAGAISNAGTINIDAFTLTISGGANGGNSTNSGTITAGSLSTGSLIISNTALNNAGGTLIANGAGSFVDLLNSSITGGTLTTSNGGLIRSDAGSTSTLSNLTISSGTQFSVQNDAALNLVGTITNNGNISLDVAANVADVRLSAGDALLTGSGTLTLNGGNAHT